MSHILDTACRIDVPAWRNMDGHSSSSSSSSGVDGDGDNCSIPRNATRGEQCAWDPDSQKCVASETPAAYLAARCASQGKTQPVCELYKLCSWDKRAGGCVPRSMAQIEDALQCPNTGTGACQCTNPATLVDMPMRGGKFLYQQQFVDYLFPTSYGATCGAWDDAMAQMDVPVDPFGCLEGAGDTGWCLDRWCYVEPCGCMEEGLAIGETVMFGDQSPLFFSYAACCGTIAVEVDCVYGGGGEGLCSWDADVGKCVDGTAADAFLAARCASKGSHEALCNKYRSCRWEDGVCRERSVTDLRAELQCPGYAPPKAAPAAVPSPKKDVEQQAAAEGEQASVDDGVSTAVLGVEITIALIVGCFAILVVIGYCANKHREKQERQAQSARLCSTPPLANPHCGHT